MPQSYSKIYSHFVFSTLDREPTITPDIAPRLYEYISGIFRNKGCQLIQAGGTSDHIHLLAIQSREISASDIMREVKTNSSKWIHETFSDARSLAWQRGFGVFSVSHSQADSVVRYILNQEEHHRNKTFKEEYVEFLEAHGIEYDIKYLWD